MTGRDHMLPPTIFRKNPRRRRRRTSPTKLGLDHAFESYRRATSVGSDAGRGCPVRSKTMETMKNLERFRGHFLQLVRTGRLAAASSAYVSTVDSGGNLAGTSS